MRIFFCATLTSRTTAVVLRVLLARHRLDADLETVRARRRRR